MDELSKVWHFKVIKEKMDQFSSWMKIKVRDESEVWSLRYSSEINIYYEN